MDWELRFLRSQGTQHAHHTVRSCPGRGGRQGENRRASFGDVKGGGVFLELPAPFTKLCKPYRDANADGPGGVSNAERKEKKRGINRLKAD